MAFPPNRLHVGAQMRNIERWRNLIDTIPDNKRDFLTRD
jgi:hypothetical protein